MEMNFSQAKDLLNGVGYRLISEQSDRFRTAWNSLMSAMSDFTNWNRVVMWYAGNKYWEDAKALCNDYDRGKYSLNEIIEKMKSAGVQWYRELFSKINTILTRNNLKVTGDRGEFSYRGEPYKIVPVGRSGSGCSFEVRKNSDANTPQIHSEADVFARTQFIEDPDDALSALERIVEEEFSDTHRQFSEAKELLESVGFIVEHVNSHPLDPKYFVRYLKKLLDNYGFQERGKATELRAMSYLYTYDTNATRFEISEKGEYDDEIIVNILFSGISSDGSVYTIVADDVSYNGDNIEDFKADLDQVFKVRE